jgi:FkbM family methyltransferase
MKRAISSMSLKEFLMRAVRRVGPARGLAKAWVRSVVKHPTSLEKLNRTYNKLNSDERAIFQILFAKCFVDNEPTIEDTVWTINFAGQRIKMPLRNKKLWLDWDNAVSILGHDIEVKKTYENILNSNFRPKSFFDVGANYGTHSLLFLVHDIRTTSFEPNPICRGEFLLFSELNNVASRLVPKAIGDQKGEAEFWFPLRETWLGSIVDSTREALASQHKVERLNVEVISLDDFVDSSGIAPELIKIDTEGSELNVLNGASKTIQIARPVIIFEANLLSDRDKLWKMFVKFDYLIFELPYYFDGTASPLSQHEFARSDQVNFISVARDHRSLTIV